MRDALKLWVLLAILSMEVLVSLVQARADDPPEPAKEHLKRQAQQLRDSLDWYRVSPARDPRAALKPEIVLRWGNPTRLQQGETALVLWADAGRPEALASVYPWNGFLVYECISLARANGLQASEGDKSVWTPATPGVTFRDVPEAPAPAGSAVARLAQMRGIAGQFRVTMSSVKAGVADREEMRLLPKPIHRTDPAVAGPAHPDLIDAAAFAFVQGTDPEAILLIEAVRRGTATTWQYAFGRATGWDVEARLGPTVVWKAVAQPSWSDPKSTGVALGRRLVD